MFRAFSPVYFVWIPPPTNPVVFSPQRSTLGKFAPAPGIRITGVGWSNLINFNLSPLIKLSIIPSSKFVCPVFLVVVS